MLGVFASAMNSNVGKLNRHLSFHQLIFIVFRPGRRREIWLD
jgi:hypothetical protein